MYAQFERQKSAYDGKECQYISSDKIVFLFTLTITDHDSDISIILTKLNKSNRVLRKKIKVNKLITFIKYTHCEFNYEPFFSHQTKIIAKILLVSFQLVYFICQTIFFRLCSHKIVRLTRVLV